MTRLTDLSPAQIRLMIKLDDGFDREDSVGQEIGDLRPIDNLDVGAMVRMGLVVADEGRGGQVWVRLTEKGRKVREEGEA
ncbi:hypothetical protein [Aureimonas mangrovi]|uniref:hypothetical protein n=1 Tax=Aureimonas mangrovi TaxID=2758041 RepID=UPI00163DDE4C|nr:hypothetical protein [Aureimonas mangrovi]